MVERSKEILPVLESALENEKLKLNFAMIYENRK
jgi:hypothetical protein